VDPNAGRDSSAEPVLEVRDLMTHLRTGAGLVKAVDGIGFSVRAGEVLGIVGESGSGKSMTCMSLLGLLPDNVEHRSGQVLLRGRDLMTLSERELEKVRGRDISMVLQDPMSSLNPVMRIAEQVSEPLRVHDGVGRREARARAVELLESVHIPDPERRARAYPHEMSGGMRQRAVGAAAVACRPSVILADEPTTSLDVTIQAQYLEMLTRVQSDLGAALVFITHDLGLVAKICDTVAVMYAGRIVEYGTVESVYSAPRHPYTAGLLESIPSIGETRRRLPAISGSPPDFTRLGPGCAFADRCHLASDLCRTEKPPLVESREGKVACWHTESVSRDDIAADDGTPADGLAVTVRGAVSDAGDSGPLLEARRLRRLFESRQGLLGRGRSLVRAVDDVSFTLRPGRTLGIVGESGSGKTTVSKMMLSLDRPTGGEVLFRGQDVTRLRRGDLDRYRRRVQAVFQDPYSSLNPRLSVGRTVAEPLMAAGTGLSRRDIDERVAESLVAVGLRADHSDAYPHELSGGQRQRVAIARAITTRPDVIVLDEPVSALDVSLRAQVINLLMDLQDDLGLAYIFISHDLAVVRHMSDDIVVMYLGRVVEAGSSADVFADPKHPYTRALMSNVLPAQPGAASSAITLQGEIPSPLDPPSGCHFRTRCPFVMEVCAAEAPPPVDYGAGHTVACHLYPADPSAAPVIDAGPSSAIFQGSDGLPNTTLEKR
jgi:oligopeptide/dipeptide ABC transporter ATP-binding protein